MVSRSARPLLLLLPLSLPPSLAVLPSLLQAPQIPPSHSGSPSPPPPPLANAAFTPRRWRVPANSSDSRPPRRRSASRRLSTRRQAAIVMMDTRSVLDPPRGALQIQYPQLAFELNRGYACAHGYDLLYLHMQSETCEHARLGVRHPSYCKLAGVAEALRRGYALVAFLDSDAFFQNVTVTLPALPQIYGGGRTAVADAMFAWDRPFSYGPNAGVQLWRNTAVTARLLTLWWHLPGGKFHMTHDFEQHALQWKLQHLHSFRSHIHTLQLESMAMQLDSNGWPEYRHAIAHIDHGRNFYRLLLMGIALLRRAGQPAPLLAPRGASWRGNSSADRVNATGGAGGERRAAKSGMEGYRTGRLRQRVLHQAYRLLKSRNPVRAPPIGFPPSSCAHSRTIVVPFDPSYRAKKSLSLAAIGTRLDMARKARLSAAARLERRRLALIDGLWGAPLELVNCSLLAARSRSRPEEIEPRHHFWGTWANRSNTLALLPPPWLQIPQDLSFCLRVGPSRAPRQPDFTLAQLWPCHESAVNRTYTKLSGPPHTDEDSGSVQSYIYNWNRRTLSTGRGILTLQSLARLSGTSSAVYLKNELALLQDALGHAVQSATSGQASPAPLGQGRRLGWLQSWSRWLGGAAHAWNDTRVMAGLARNSSASGRLWGGDSSGRGRGKMNGRGRGWKGNGKGWGKGIGKAWGKGGGKGGGKGWGKGNGKGFGKGFGKGRGKGRGKGVGMGNKTAPLTAQQLQQIERRRESREKRGSEWMNKPCVSIYANKGDKSSEDCQEWCDESKIGHCRYCKCRGCKHCHGDLTLPDWAVADRPSDTTAHLQCKTFGLCSNSSFASAPLCLSVWRGELHEGGPLVWSRCRDDIVAHQQWELVPLNEMKPRAQVAPEAFSLQLTISASKDEPLCVAAPVPLSLLA